MPVTCHNCNQSTFKIVRCSLCLRSVYCSAQCRNLHHAQHVIKCKETRIAGWNMDVLQKKKGEFHSPNNQFISVPAPPNSIGGIDEDWTSDLPRTELLIPKALERLINSFRLRRHDEFLLHRNQILLKSKSAIDMFTDFYKKMQKKDLLPMWWDIECEKAVFKMALYLVNEPFTEANAALIQPLEPMILRMLAEQVYGSCARPTTRFRRVN